MVKGNNRQRRRGPRVRRERPPNQIANPRNQIRSLPEEVTVRFRVGLDTSIPLTNNNVASGVRLNDPLSVVQNFPTRAEDFVMYRIHSIEVYAMPTYLGTGSTPGGLTSVKQYVTALVSSALSSVTAPTNFNAVLELPQSQLRPMDLSNPLSRRRIVWRASDVNSLTYTNRGLAPELTTVNLYASTSSGSASSLANWAVAVTGWMDIEFKGLATF